MKLLPIASVWRPLALVMLAASMAGAAVSAPEGGQRDRGGERGERSGERGHRDGERGERGERGHRDDYRGHRDHRGGDRGDHHRGNDRHHRPHRDWWDGTHGHNHRYPAPGWAVRTLPSHSRFVWWGGINYRYFDGVWYTPHTSGFVVVRPPIGIVVHDLPAVRTLLAIGGLTYLYANGVYYRERTEGGYEVVPQPLATPDGAPPERMYVYPRNGQPPQQQASDEYECHKWAVTQSRFDPTAVATGTAGSTPGRRADYQRAHSACLEGRGYTVR